MVEAESEWTGEVFVMNLLRLPDDRPYTVGPDHVLRIAKNGEIERIRRWSKRMSQPTFAWGSCDLWEREWPFDWDERRILSQEKWRYFVLTFRGRREEAGRRVFPSLRNIELATLLAPVELEFGVISARCGGKSSTGYWPDNVFQILQEMTAQLWDESCHDSVLVSPGTADLDFLRLLAEQLAAHDDAVLNLRSRLIQMLHLKGLPHRSPLRFLGYFALLESLLTHVPKPSDPYDSITRQVANKLALLNNRMQHKIDCTPFGGVSFEKLWKKMYSYRSLIAHGEPAAPVPLCGEMAVLKDHPTALRLLKDTVKGVLRQCLVEPQLVADLRSC
jgi:hypothetical protein